MEANLGTVPVLMAHIERLLRAALQSEFWQDALATVDSRALTPILYHDEITCGNILNPTKEKILACYVSFKGAQAGPSGLVVGSPSRSGFCGRRIAAKTKQSLG